MGFMNSVFDEKNYYGKELIIADNTNILTGFWAKNKKWISDVDISGIPFHLYPNILLELQEGFLAIGFVKEHKEFYGIFFDEEGHSKCYSTSYNILDLLYNLNNVLIYMQEQSGLKM